jgi:hypothetical protein
MAATTMESVRAKRSEHHAFFRRRVVVCYIDGTLLLAVHEPAQTRNKLVGERGRLKNACYKPKEG